MINIYKSSTCLIGAYMFSCIFMYSYGTLIFDKPLAAHIS